MRYILIVLYLAISISLKAQSKFKTGLVYQFGASTLYGGHSNMNDATNYSPSYFIKISNGIGIKSQYLVFNNFIFNLQAVYQQKGASFDKNIYSYTPKFSFNYLDLRFGLSYRTNALLKTSRLEFGVNGIYSRLLSATRVNYLESFNIINDSQPNDFGVSLNGGLIIPRLDCDEFQIKVFANSGFTNTFSGVLNENGLVGKNLIFGIQLGYLFGKRNNK